ncbi:MAG: TolB family protein [Phycisphaerae bacterium]
MPLHSRLIRFASIAAGVTCVGGCAMNGTAGNAADAPAATTVRGGPIDTNRDLRLFGDTGTESDVVFEGQAAASVKQHTFTVDGADFDPALSATSEQLVFASTRHSRFSHLYRKSIDGATITQITDARANDAQPVFNPTGQRIAFTSDRSGNWDIWVVDADGRNPMQVSNALLPELHPSWSPNGRSLVYCRINPKESRGELWVAELDHPGVRRLIGEGMFPAWSPTGAKIAYQRARQRGSRWFSIWTIDYNAGEPRFPTEIASSPRAAMIAPAWSTDGRQIAFTAVEHDPPPAFRPADTGSDTLPTSRICIVDADGRGLQYLTDPRNESYSPSWASDDRIYFTRRLDKTETIWSVRPFRPPLPKPPVKTVDDKRSTTVTETAVGRFDGGEVRANGT